MFYIVATKKNFRRAVDRNLARRRIRAALNEIKPGWRRGLTGKIFISPELHALPFPELKRRVEALLQNV